MLHYPRHYPCFLGSPLSPPPDFGLGFSIPPTNVPGSGVMWVQNATLAARKVLGSSSFLSHAPEAPNFGPINGSPATYFAGSSGGFTAVANGPAGAATNLWNVQVRAGDCDDVLTEMTDKRSPPSHLESSIIRAAAATRRRLGYSRGALLTAPATPARHSARYNLMRPKLISSLASRF